MAKNNKTLVFNGLMQGMSWDQIKEAKDEIKRHQGEKPPTKKDILTDWIIGKDYMLQQQGNSFALGGDYLSWLNQYKEENPLDNGESYSWGDLSKAKLKDSFSNGNGFNSALGIAGTAMDWTKGFIDSVNSIDNSAQLNDAKYIAGQQINFGDNASLMNTQSNLQYADTNATATDVGGHSFGQSAMNVGKDAFSGVTTGLNIGGPIGAAIGGAVGLAKGVIQEIVTNSKAKEAAETANLISGIANDQVNQRMGYTSDKSRQLAVLDQLQHMTKNGGKLKKSHKFANGGVLNNYYYGLEEVNAGGSHEENPNEGVVVSYAPDGLPNKVEEGETIHNDYVYSKRLEANKKVLNSNLLDEKYEGKSFADISKKLTEDRKQRPNDPISVRTNEENLARLQGAQEELKLDNKTKEVKRFLGSLNNDQLNALQQEMMDEYEAYAEQLAQQQEQEDQAYQEEQAAQEGMFGRGGHLKQSVYGNSFLWNDEYIPEDEEIFYGKQGPIIINNKFAYELQTPKYNSSTNPDYVEPVSYGTFIEESPKSKENPKGKTKGNSSSSLAPLRFAEAFGSAGQYLSDILGLSNQPDYSNARMYQRAIDNIGGVNFTPIGNYLTYTPIDTEYLANQQMATAAARRNYGNVVGNYTLGLLGDYNTLNQIGATAIAARQQDQEQKNKVAEFNRTTNARNSEMSLDAQKQNAALRAQRAQEYRYLADIMTKERDINEAARAANYQNFMSNLAAIGREDFNYDQIKWMIDHGVFPVGAESYLTGLKI